MKANEGNMRQYETKRGPGLGLLIFFLVAPYNQTSCGFIFLSLSSNDWKHLDISLSLVNAKQMSGTVPDSVLKDTGSLRGPVPSSFFGLTLNS